MMKETKLILKNDEPLMFSPKMAEKLGLNEAIMLQQIHYWTEMNKANNSNYYDGFYWTFNSYVNWQKNQFSFWSVKTIQRILTKLEKDNLLISGNYNKKKYDKTKWYRINYELIYELFNEPIGQNDQMDEDKMTKWMRTDCPDPLDRLSRPIGQNDQMDEDKMTKPIPETNIDYKENNKENNKEINNPKEEINYVLNTKEKNIMNSSLVIQKDMIIDYYFEKYNDTYNRTHDEIDKEKIYSKIDNFSLSYNIDSGTWIELIDYHFSFSNIETNGSIDDFLNDNIIKKYLDSINNDSLVSKEENINNSSLVQKDTIIDYYFEEYKNAYNKLHDKIDYQKIYSKIDNFSSRYNIDNQMWIELIDFHFNLSSLKTDGSIHHFLSDNIIKIYLTEVNKFKNSSLGSTKENYLEYAHIDNNIKEIIQYFIDKYYSYFGINYWEKEDFYVSDIKQYAELIELLSSDFGLEVALDCWKKKIDTFFELGEYDKNLNTFLQFSVMNDIIAGQMTNSEYYEEQQEYDDVELPF